MPINETELDLKAEHAKKLAEAFMSTFEIDVSVGDGTGELGHGTEGTVYRYKLKAGAKIPPEFMLGPQTPTSQHRAIKVLNLPSKGSDEAQSEYWLSAEREGAILGNLGRCGQIFIIQTKTGAHLALIDECISYNDVFGDDLGGVIEKLKEGHLKNRAPELQRMFDETPSVFLAQSLLSMQDGLGFFYEGMPNSVHRDVKPMNFLLGPARVDMQTGAIGVRSVITDFTGVKEAKVQHQHSDIPYGTPYYSTMESVQAGLKDANYRRDLGARRISSLHLIAKSLPGIEVLEWLYINENEKSLSVPKYLYRLSQSNLSSSTLLEKYFDNLVKIVPPDRAEHRILLASLKDYFLSWPNSELEDSKKAIHDWDASQLSTALEMHAQNLMTYYLLRDGDISARTLKEIEFELPHSENFKHCYEAALKHASEKIGIVTSGDLNPDELKDLIINFDPTSRADVAKLFLAEIDNRIGYQAESYQAPTVESQVETKKPFNEDDAHALVFYALKPVFLILHTAKHSIEADPEKFDKDGHFARLHQDAYKLILLYSKTVHINKPAPESVMKFLDEIFGEDKYELYLDVLLKDLPSKLDSFKEAKAHYLAIKAHRLAENPEERQAKTEANDEMAAQYAAERSSRHAAQRPPLEQAVSELASSLDAFIQENKALADSEEGKFSTGHLAKLENLKGYLDQYLASENKDSARLDMLLNMRRWHHVDDATKENLEAVRTLHRQPVPLSNPSR